VGSTLDQGLGGMMRVSVVATGIDAMDVNTEMPVPRRSMKAPLPQQTTDDAAEVTPEATVAATEIAAEEQQPLFEEMDVQRTAAQEQAEDIFADEDKADDLPPPAYQPKVAAFEPRNDDIEATETDAFVAPRAPAPGTPSPEALARLRAAAQRAAPNQQTAAQARQPEQQPMPQTEVTSEKPRFGINSLINRMTGHAEGEAQPQTQARQQPPVQQPPRVAAAPQPVQDQDPDQERIEIPAFLRRQAN